MLSDPTIHRRRAVVLLVDDDPGDQELTRRALQNDTDQVELRTVNDGQAALEYLRHSGVFHDPQSSPRPDLILLDLNMPRLNGFRVLQKLRDDPELKQIPVIVLTTSNRDEDILQSYVVGCNSFIQKPIAIGEFMAAVQMLRRYWFELVALPATAPSVDGGHEPNGT